MTNELLLDNIENVRMSIIPHKWDKEHILIITNSNVMDHTEVYLDEEALREMAYFINNYLRKINETVDSDC
jgi:hypothetical protein